MKRVGHITAYVKAHPGCTQREVSEALGLHLVSVTQAMPDLLARDLITRTREGGRYRLWPTGRPAPELSTQQEQIVLLLRDHGPLTRRAIAAALRWRGGHIGTVLTRAKRAGLVRRLPKHLWEAV